MRIGVDVGGTNTDAVLMDGAKVVAACKQQTSHNVSDGIVNAIKQILTVSGVIPERIECVMIGTTHFTNAFVERKGLLEVGVIRLSLPAARGIPPLLDWPRDLASAIGRHCYQVKGGYQFDGKVNSPLDEVAIANAARQLRVKGIKTIAVTGVFSSINADMELRAEEIIRNEIGDVAITLSHKVGRAGLLERENATIMNACLADLSSKVVNSFRAALKFLNIKAPFYISQNDGTLMTASYVERFPVMTFASGPTNSMRGAAYLSGLKDALVADIGGTTTDIGMLSNGFPRESSVVVDIGGVRTNFRMPDVLALGLGGGSIVNSINGSASLGPQSVGYELLNKARVFGGDTLTASDIAVAKGYANFGNSNLVADLPESLINNAVAEIHNIISDGIDRIKINADPVPLILVGGGSVLVDGSIDGASDVIVPKHADVANAIGASIAQVGGEVDRVFSYDELGREGAIEQAQDEAMQKAIGAGAVDSSLAVLELEETPLAYAPGGAVRLRVKVAGDLHFGSNQSPS